jgi:FtsZ-interacting cell division protein ZipA
MSITIYIIIGGAIALIALVALALYKAGFRMEELLVKLGLVEAKLTRKTDNATAESPTDTPPAGQVTQAQEVSGPGSLIADSPQQASGPGTSQRQSATAGGQIRGSGQTTTAPANQQQQASEGGVIKDSDQKVE